MKKRIVILSTFLYLFPLTINALDIDLKKKYPFSVLTDDYGILNKTDLNSYLDGVKLPTDFPNEKHFYLYWQCFPREHVAISLRDIGYSSYNLDENDSELTIRAYTESGTHLYGMRRNSAVSSNMHVFNQYQKLVRGQKYICLEGTYFFYKDKITDGKKERIYYWTFEKMKTKKGCGAYFQDGCHDEKIKMTASGM